MSDLLRRLQGLGNAEHDDLSVAHDASEEIVALRSRVAELEAVQQWHPIETAPKDAPILAWCDHEADSFIEPDGRLTLYAAHAEGLSHAPDGLNIIEWGGGFSESQEDGGGWLPDWWFVVGSEFEQAANPTHWMPLPDPPK